MLQSVCKEEQVLFLENNRARMIYSSHLTRPSSHADHEQSLSMPECLALLARAVDFALLIDTKLFVATAATIALSPSRPAPTEPTSPQPGVGIAPASQLTEIIARHLVLLSRIPLPTGPPAVPASMPLFLARLDQALLSHHATQSSAESVCTALLVSA
jgi:hypothetical protein